MDSATEVGAYDAKTRLSELLDRVEQGAHYTITRHGRPVAELRPVGGAASTDLAGLVAAAAQLRATLACALSDPEIAAARDEGRR